MLASSELSGSFASPEPEESATSALPEDFASTVSSEESVVSFSDELETDFVSEEAIEFSAALELLSSTTSAFVELEESQAVMKMAARADKVIILQTLVLMQSKINK